MRGEELEWASAMWSWMRGEKNLNQGSVNPCTLRPVIVPSELGR